MPTEEAPLEKLQRHTKKILFLEEVIETQTQSIQALQQQIDPLNETQQKPGNLFRKQETSLVFCEKQLESIIDSEEDKEEFFTFNFAFFYHLEKTTGKTSQKQALVSKPSDLY